MNYNVLIVEDEPVLARNMHLYLERQGLSCQTAGSGEEGLALLDEQRPDVVVLDANTKPGGLNEYGLATYKTTDGFAQKNVFLVGDAAGFADPVTAEGISNSIFSGRLAAQSIIESKLDVKTAEKLYLEKLEEKILPEIRTGIILANLFYKNEFIVNMFVKKYGQIFIEAVADFFTGKRSYPSDYKASIKRKIKEFVF